MNAPWKRRRRGRGARFAAMMLGAVVIALPFLPSFRRYVRMGTM